MSVMLLALIGLVIAVIMIGGIVGLVVYLIKKNDLRRAALKFYRSESGRWKSKCTN